jgi:myo-inositol 2-dehydrogenase/D-chiro-inositol 1-dehydrogenase
MENDRQQIGRRAFLGAASGMMILKPRLVRGAAANSAVRIGLLGCGGRGTEDAEGIVKNGGARLVALADMFDDQLAAARKRFDALAEKNGTPPLDAKQIFSGPRAFEQIAASKEVDAVVIATPPYFHPEHLGAVVAAGKHVYCEKPVAVDVPGAKRVVEIGAKAHRKLSLDVGFQIRMAPPFIELVKRIHGGALGEIASAEAHYFCGALERPDWPGASPAMRRLRNWVYDRVLSGDIIVEQNIHVIDICNWVLQGHPMKAVGTGGRKGRTDQGDAWSHFSVVFTYGGNVHVGFNSTQFGKGGFDANERFFGPRGNSTSPYTGPVQITGPEAWSWGESGQAKGELFSITGKFAGNLEQADLEKHKAFIESITSGDFHSQAALGAESALSAMLGRMAAYAGREVTWDEMMRADESWDAGIDLAKLT